jgi:DNA-binding CsgD family transcriptional regulator
VNVADARRVEALTGLLREPRGGPFSGGEFLPALNEALGADSFGAYDVIVDDGPRLGRAFYTEPGLVTRFRGFLDEHSMARWGLFEPEAPAEGQRNRAVTLPSAMAVGPGGLARWQRVVERMVRQRLGGASAGRAKSLAERVYPLITKVFTTMAVWPCDQMRVLVCDGPVLLAWIGGFQQRRFSPRQSRMLEALVPALRERLLMERYARETDVTLSALAAALDAIPGEAFVVGPGRMIRHANAAGRAALSRDRLGTRARLDEALAYGVERPAAGHVARLAPLPGMPDYDLVVLVRRDAALQARLGLAVARWGLTPRQREVLSQLARGRANRSISAQLRCAERTIEVHVSALLAKAGAASRAELVARFWTLS